MPLGESMLYDDFKAKTKRWNQFSQVDTLGAFDFYTSIISLDAVTADDISASLATFDISDSSPAELLESLTPAQYQRLSKILPLAIHEYTHFIDATSTVWGLRHLHLMNEAYVSDERRGSKEENFFKAKKFYDHVRAIRLPNYYTVTNSSQQNIRPWHSTISIGRLFTKDGGISKRPVLFSRFANAKGGILVRSPISTVSLLEASAMSQEVMAHASLLNKTEAGFRLVEQAEFSRRILNHIYNVSDRVEM
jgi:hypothetical protein